MLADAISGFILAALGLYTAVKGHSYALGSLSQPGPGFFPFWASILMVVCSAAVLAKGLRKMFLERVEGAAREDAPPPAMWSKVWLTVAILAAYTTLLAWVGFGLSTFLAMLALTRLDKRTTWIGSCATAALGAAGFWLVFAYLLKVSFPQQVFGF